MTAVILAGGLGTRLRPVTMDRIPKVMAEVQGKPFIYWQLRYLKKQGIKKTVLAVHHHADQVVSYLGNTFDGIELTYSLEQIPLGTGGALRLALEQTDVPLIWVLNGDTWFPVNQKSMLSFHHQSQNQVTLALKKRYDFDRYGSVTLNKDYRIIGFREKQPLAEGYINGGLYLLHTDVLNSMPLGQRFSLEHDFFEQKINDLAIGGYRSKAKFIDIGLPEDFNQIQKFKLL